MTQPLHRRTCRGYIYRCKACLLCERAILFPVRSQPFRPRFATSIHLMSGCRTPVRPTHSNLIRRGRRFLKFRILTQMQHCSRLGPHLNGTPCSWKLPRRANRVAPLKICLTLRSPIWGGILIFRRWILRLFFRFTNRRMHRSSVYASFNEDNIQWCQIISSIKSLYSPGWAGQYEK